MRISKRIQAITDMISSGHAVCDVGCDHAYTSIALVESGKCPFAVASDVRPGPLAAARKNIEDALFAEKIETCLADGVPADIHNRLPAGPKTLVITGMGGLLICRILDMAGENTAGFDELVLSPQSDLNLVREKLGRIGFTLDDEEMLSEDGKFYTVMRAKRDPGGNEGHADSDHAGIRSEAELLYGPVLLAKRHPVLRRYLEKQEKVLKGILDSLKTAGLEGSVQYRDTERKMEVLHEAFRYY